MSAVSRKPGGAWRVFFRWIGGLFGLTLFSIVAGLAAWLYLHERGRDAVADEWLKDRPPVVRNIGAVNSLRILPLVNWHTNPDDGRNLRGEVGVSYLVETDAATVLFDLGHNANDESPSPLEFNMRALGIDFDRIDAIFISHAHFDHVGGRRWSRAGSFSPGVRQTPLPDLPVYTPVPMSYPGLTPESTPRPRALSPGIATTGTIPRQLMIGRIDEQALVVNLKDRGLVLIVGCGHQTLERLVARVEAAFREKIYAVIGDLHYPVPVGRLNILGLNGQRLFASGAGLMRPLEMADVDRDLELLKARNPGIVALGGHDSSDAVIARFARAFGERYRHVRVGEWIKVR